MGWSQWQSAQSLCPDAAQSAPNVGLVRDADHPARAPFHKGVFTIPIHFHSSGDLGSFTVPEGPRLVIEYVSAFADYPPTVTSIRLSITTTANGVTVKHAIPIIQRDLSAGRGHAVWGSAVALYADGGTDVVFEATVDGMDANGTTFVTPKVSGHLVEVEP